MNKLPTLFLPHGAPTFALQPGPAGKAIADFAKRIARPEAVLVISAHWNTTIPSSGASVAPETIHDYWGFPDALYSIEYPARGSPELALKVAEALEAAGIEAGIDRERGLDHGAWIPLRLLYPDASLPVVPLSIQYRRDPEHHFGIGRALSRLKEEGVLIVASGNLTHNLNHYRPGSASTLPYVADFSGWVREMLDKKDIASLLAYRKLAPGAKEAHPTDEHLLPFYVAMGAAGEDFTAETIYEGVYAGMLAMDAFSFQPSEKEQSWQK